jgi:alpha,alpha-trehalase
VDARGPFPPEALRQYALIADGERGALCGPHGEIVWMCAPRWHDDAVFSTLLGGAGAYAVTPDARCVWGGQYEPHTLIWCNRWATDQHILLECRDALAVPSELDTVVVLRRIIAVEGRAQVMVLLDVRACFGAAPMTDVHRGDDGVWTARSAGLMMHWSGAGDARVDDQGRLTMHLALEPGDSHDLVLEITAGQLSAEPPKAKRLWRATEKWWAGEVPSFEQSVAARDAAHAYAIMRGLTSRDGAMVAAATTSLPESADNGTNYDYRYAWIRDQTYAGIAAAAAGGYPLLEAATRTAVARLLADGPKLQPAYRVDGTRVPDMEPLDLPGYPGADAVRGNRIGNQFQLDIFGEALLLFARAAEHEMLDADGWRAVVVAVAAIEQRWDEPDSGIWELEPQWWTHSRLSCAAGLRGIGAVAPRSLRLRIDDLADHLLRATGERCLSPGGWWRRSPDDDRVDAALLLPSVRGALPAHDPRTVATLRAVRETLVEDGYVYRFAPERGELGDDEGAFLLCGFILAFADLQQGDRVAAFRSFERNRAACGPAALLAEEFDVRERQLRGNLPQTFVHALLLETSVALADSAP